MDSIERAIRNMDTIQSEYRPEEGCDDYSFNEVKECIINNLSLLGRDYFIGFNFPKLLRIHKKSILIKVAEFTPYSVKYFDSSFKEHLCTNENFDKYSEYLSGKRRLDNGT